MGIEAPNPCLAVKGANMNCQTSSSCSFLVPILNIHVCPPAHMHTHEHTHKVLHNIFGHMDQIKENMQFWSYFFEQKALSCSQGTATPAHLHVPPSIQEVKRFQPKIHRMLNLRKGKLNRLICSRSVGLIKQNQITDSAKQWVRNVS